MTPFASVAMLEKLALLKIALCSALALTIDSFVCPDVESSGTRAVRFLAPVFIFEMAIESPDSMMRR
jgi:hypothetical protein